MGRWLFLLCVGLVSLACADTGGEKECKGGYFLVERTDAAVKVFATTTGNCPPPSCGNGAICEGRFNEPDGACNVTVTADGFGSCSVDIEYPGPDHWLDVVASPNDAGGIECTVRRVEQSCNGL